MKTISILSLLFALSLAAPHRRYSTSDVPSNTDFDFGSQYLEKQKDDSTMSLPSDFLTNVPKPDRSVRGLFPADDEDAVEQYPKKGYSSSFDYESAALPDYTTQELPKDNYDYQAQAQSYPEDSFDSEPKISSSQSKKSKYRVGDFFDDAQSIYQKQKGLFPKSLRTTSAPPNSPYQSFDQSFDDSELPPNKFDASKYYDQITEAPKGKLEEYLDKNGYWGKLALYAKRVGKALYQVKKEHPDLVEDVKDLKIFKMITEYLEKGAKEHDLGN